MPKSNKNWDEILRDHIDGKIIYPKSSIYTIPLDTSQFISKAEMRLFEEEMWNCMTWWQKLKYLFMHKKIKRRYYL